MDCMKCGRETEHENVFCPDCLTEMEKYPVRPDTVVLLPRRRESSIIKKVPKRHTITAEEQITLLDNIGFVWELESTWDEGYRHAKEYFETFHNLSMQKSYKCSDGYALGIWVYNYRNAYNKLYIYSRLQ